MKKKADLHVHCKYSNDPSEWILRQMGMNECYTEVEEVYRMAKDNGMDYVVITDHNTVEGSLLLNKMHPKDTFTGVEVTTAFPEDGCKMHILVYDLTREQWEEIDQLRDNIYHLREYIMNHNLPYSVAHATYAVNNKLNIEVFEKLILLFDVFEGINGARNAYFNDTWTEALLNLTPQKLEELYHKHGIEPISETPWIKGFTGGSDDHAGLFIGRTWTEATEARSKDEFLRKLRDKHTMCAGRSNNYKSMAFIFSKIVNDHMSSKKSSKQNRFVKVVNNILFSNSGPNIKEAYLIHRMKMSKKKKERVLARFIDRLDTELTNNTELKQEERFDKAYACLSDFCDDQFKIFTKKANKEINKGSLMKWVNNITSVLPVGYVSIPFTSTWKHLNKDRKLLERFRSLYIDNQQRSSKNSLWFTDTFLDLNGVSVTINNMSKYALEQNAPLKVVTANPKLPFDQHLTTNIINLPTSNSYTPKFYDAYTMHFPSLLKSLELIEQENPDEIIISTPGPVGLIGLLCSRILGIPCTGIYHSDFGAQLDCIMGDGYSPLMIEKFTFWFYGQMDTISVPTNEYMDILETNGLNRAKMKIFKRGIDENVFKYDLTNREKIKSKYGIEEGFTLIYAGRISEDKNLKFLIDVYKRLEEKHKTINIIIAGNGPMLSKLNKELKSFKRAKILGQVTRDELAKLYSVSDLLVFPSTTDTFGMVVLEAQACGLPVLVSNQGGPQEIIIKDQTGFALSTAKEEFWVNKIDELIELNELKPESYLEMRLAAARYVYEQFTREKALDDLLQGHNITESGKKTYRSKHTVNQEINNDRIKGLMVSE